MWRSLGTVRISDLQRLPARKHNIERDAQPEPSRYRVELADSTRDTKIRNAPTEATLNTD